VKKEYWGGGGEKRRERGAVDHPARMDGNTLPECARMVLHAVILHDFKCCAGTHVAEFNHEGLVTIIGTGKCGKGVEYDACVGEPDA